MGPGVGGGYLKLTLERLQLISDRDALIAAEAPFFQGLHNGGGEVLEAGLPDAVVRRVVPNRSTLQIKQCKLINQLAICGGGG